MNIYVKYFVLQLLYWVPFITGVILKSPFVGMGCGLALWSVGMCIVSKRNFGRFNFIAVLFGR